MGFSTTNRRTFLTPARPVPAPLPSLRGGLSTGRVPGSGHQVRDPSSTWGAVVAPLRGCQWLFRAGESGPADELRYRRPLGTVVASRRQEPRNDGGRRALA